MNRLDQLNADPLPWLLEHDTENPGVRYFALRDILKKPVDDPEVIQAQQDAMRHGPVPAILAAQSSPGYWCEPGPGYYPKYRSTVWSICFLAQFGADGSHPQVKAGCEYLLNNGRAGYGGFSLTGKLDGLIHCLQGNLCAALIDLGWMGDNRLDEALEWLARSITGAGIAPAEKRQAPIRYYRSGNSAPGFACSANNHLPCAWGAVKTMLALGKIPADKRSDHIQTAIEVGVEFLLSRNPATADYPMGYAQKPSRSWFQFGYPIGYVTDVLQNLEALTALGHGADQRLLPAVDLLLSKQDSQGRWKLEYTYNGKTWVDVERKKQPSKWVTLRAARVLSHIANARTN